MENAGKISARRQSNKGYASSHRLKWGPLPPNDVDGIAQHVREGERRKGLKGYKYLITQIPQDLYTDAVHCRF